MLIQVNLHQNITKDKSEDTVSVYFTSGYWVTIIKT